MEFKVKELLEAFRVVEREGCRCDDAYPVIRDGRIVFVCGAAGHPPRVVEWEWDNSQGYLTPVFKYVGDGGYCGCPHKILREKE